MKHLKKKFKHWLTFGLVEQTFNTVFWWLEQNGCCGAVLSIITIKLKATRHKGVKIHVWYKIIVSILRNYLRYIHSLSMITSMSAFQCILHSVLKTIWIFHSIIKKKTDPEWLPAYKYQYFYLVALCLVFFYLYMHCYLIIIRSIHCMHTHFQCIYCTGNVYTYTRFLTENISFYCIQFLPAQCSLWGSVAWDCSYCWSTGICTPLSLWLLQQPWLPTLDLDSCLCIFKRIKHHYHIYFWNIYVLIFSFLHPCEAFKMIYFVHVFQLYILEYQKHVSVEKLTCIYWHWQYM